MARVMLAAALPAQMLSLNNNDRDDILLSISAKEHDARMTNELKSWLNEKEMYRCTEGKNKDKCRSKAQVRKSNDKRPIYLFLNYQICSEHVSAETKHALIRRFL